MDRSIEELAAAWEAAVPPIEVDKLFELFRTGDWDQLQAYTAAHAPHRLATFWRLDAAPMLRLAGHSTAAITYLIGSSISAESMFRHDLHALLYAPLRFVIARNDTGRVTLTFVQPSTQLGSLGDPNVADVGTELDATVANILSVIDVAVPDGLISHSLRASGLEV